MGTLGDFMKELAVLMADADLQLPLKDETPWHHLFLQLKQAKGIEDRPAFLDNLVFDWDGPAPKCQELSEFLHALHWSAAVTAHNPTYEAIQIGTDVAERWRPSRQTAFHEWALEQAKAEFPARV